jgi:hypothetical protein
MKLILFPRINVKSGDSDASLLKTAVQLKSGLNTIHQDKAAANTAKSNSSICLYCSRKAQSDKKYKGIRDQRAKIKAEAQGKDSKIKVLIYLLRITFSHKVVPKSSNEGSFSSLFSKTYTKRVFWLSLPPLNFDLN